MESRLNGIREDRYVRVERGESGFGVRTIVQSRRTSGALHGLVQFIATFDPSEVASLLVGGFPSEASELLEGYRSFWIFRVLVHCEPRSILLAIFRSETGAPQGHKNVGTFDFYPQVRVDRLFLPLADLRPTLRRRPNRENFSSIASFAWPKMDFPLFA